MNSNLNLTQKNTFYTKKSIAPFHIEFISADGKKLMSTHMISGFKNLILLILDPYKNILFPVYFDGNKKGVFFSIPETEVGPVKEYLWFITLDFIHINYKELPSILYLQLEKIDAVQFEKISFSLYRYQEKKLHTTHQIRNLFRETVLLSIVYSNTSINVSSYLLVNKSEAVLLSNKQKELLLDYLKRTQTSFQQIFHIN